MRRGPNCVGGYPTSLQSRQSHGPTRSLTKKAGPTRIFIAWLIRICVRHIAPEALALRAVSDTDVLLVSISDRPPFHWIYEGLRKGLYIGGEHRDRPWMRGGFRARDHLVSGARRALERNPFVLSVHRHYRWNLIEADADDNKFTDCAIAGDADCVVTNDKRFNGLRDTAFPVRRWHRQRSPRLSLQEPDVRS